VEDEVAWLYDIYDEQCAPSHFESPRSVRSIETASQSRQIPVNVEKVADILLSPTTRYAYDMLMKASVHSKEKICREQGSIV
jgi:hypothetical protein